MKITCAAVGRSKNRKWISLVGIEADTETRKIRPKLLKRWKKEKFSKIPEYIGDLYSKLDWGKTYINQEQGEHFIKDLRNRKLNVRVFTTQKQLKDPSDIERIKVMDKIEMISWFLANKQKHNILLPKEDASIVKELAMQIALFAEHITEAGTTDYYIPGEEENDDLLQGLLVCCFAVRKYIRIGNDMGLGFIGWNKKSHGSLKARLHTNMRNTSFNFDYERLTS